MDTMDNVFQQALQEFLTSKRAIAKVIAKKLENQGITVDDKLLEEIETIVNKSEDDKIAFSLDEQHLNGLSPEAISTEITYADIESFNESFLKDISEIAQDVANDFSDTLLDTLKKNAPDMLQEHAADRADFESRLREKWGNLFDLLEMVIVIAYEAGEDFNHEFRPKAAASNDITFEVLTRLHARACQVAYEVLTLVRSGYADGAHARWRTLYEISVTASFIRDQGNDVAERYLLHEVVDSYIAAQQYQNYCNRLNVDPIDASELSEMEECYKKLIQRYGKVFSNQYGWAASAFQNMKKGEKISFKCIEEAADFDHWRPYFKMACHNVHAGPKGILFKLGEYPDRKVLLAGPSDRGLEEPIQGAAISLMQATVTLLTTEPNVDRLVLCNVLTKVVDEIRNACMSDD